MSNKISNLSQIREILGILSWVLGVKAKKVFYIAILFQFALSSLDVAFLILISPVVTSLVTEGAGSVPITISGLVSLDITQVFIYISVIIGVKSLLTIVLRSWVLKSFANREAEVIVSFVQNSLLEDFESAKKSHSADLLQLFTGVIGNVFTNILKPAISIVGDCLTILSILVCLAFLEPYVSIFITLYFFFFGYLVAKILGAIQSKIGSQTLQLNRDSLRIFSEIKLLSLELKLSDREDDSIKKLFVTRKKLSGFYARSNILQVTPRFIFEFLLIGGVTILVILSKSFNDSGVSVPQLALIVAAGYRVLPALNAVILNYGAFRNSVPSLYRLYQLGRRFRMDNDDIEYKNKLRSHVGQNLEGDILFSHVTYRYPGTNQDAIRNLSFRIRAGHVMVVKGPSGVGKTTLINLTLGLLQPQTGSIKLVREGVEHSIVNQFSGIRYVSQEVALLDESIGHNIAMRPITELDDERLARVAKLVGIHDWIFRNQFGFNALIGENGSQISAGERQRLGIARALFDSPSLIILDEPTANLDPISEAQVWGALEKIKGRMTVLIVSHRNVPESLYDDQLVLEEGTAK